MKKDSIAVVVEFRNELNQDVLEKFKKTPRVFFQKKVYAFSNEEEFFKDYRTYLNDTLVSGKAKAAIIGGGEPAHYLMSALSEKKIYDDLYLVDLNPDQITIELTKLDFLKSHDFEEVENFFTGKYSKDYYQTLIVQTRNKYDVPFLFENLGGAFKQNAEKEGAVWQHAKYSELFDNLKIFLNDVDSGSRKIIAVLAPIRPFLKKYSKRLDTVFLSNVQEWASIDLVSDNLFNVPYALSPEDFERISDLNYFGNAQRRVPREYRSFISRGFYHK